MAEMIECPICHCLTETLYEKGCEQCHHENGLPKYNKFWIPIDYVTSDELAIIKHNAKLMSWARMRAAQCRGGAAAGGW